MGGVDQSISAELGGFIALFVMAGALWLLARSLLKHLRVVEHTTYPGDEAYERDEAEAETLRARPGAADGQMHNRRKRTRENPGRPAPE